MSKWLASVQSLEEAHTLLPMLPDILDMKEPAKGALGALDVATVGQIVELVAGRCQTSATIGDLPMNAELISQSIIEMANSGVDYVKVGLFPARNLESCILALEATIKALTTPVIAVLFVDKEADIAILPLLKSSGFQGVMIDTAIKKGQHLRAHWSALKLSNFVKQAHQYDLLCGLAGALRCKDIPSLAQHGADYLGFRSALCQQQKRTATLDITLVKKVHDTINAINSKHKIAS
ncbi:MAG: (5-formylfuran-3-yl)methyl phosphate synthase [Gammaproteobacteria bacterium]|nr:(5-formylfuran-3-yl)methyl phosphate synthase [Gammaproteobacteria bacterium]